jgi:hypothetical protein
MSYLRRALAMLGLGIAAASPTIGTPPATASRHWDSTPDAPVNFGYKVCWLAIRTQDAAAVIAAAGLMDTHLANWQTGISAAYEGDFVFVTPPLEGWTFLVGSELPVPDQSNTQGDAPGGRTFGLLFGKLSGQFPEVQFFGSHRVSNFAAWARAKSGRIERLFSYADGAVYVNFGPQSAEERSLGFLDISGLAPEAATHALFAAAEKRKPAPTQVQQTGRDPLPDEQDVVDLAKAWSGIDPAQLEQGHFNKGTGTVGRFPTALKQRTAQ